MTAQAQVHGFSIEIGRAYDYFLRKLRRIDDLRKSATIIDEMLSVIWTYEHELYEYRNGKVYPRNVLLNKREWLEKFKE